MNGDVLGFNRNFHFPSELSRLQTFLLSIISIVFHKLNNCCCFADSCNTCVASCLIDFFAVERVLLYIFFSSESSISMVYQRMKTCAEPFLAKAICSAMCIPSFG